MTLIISMRELLLRTISNCSVSMKPLAFWLNGFGDDGAVNTVSELMSGAGGAPARAETAKCTEEVKRMAEQKKKKYIKMTRHMKKIIRLVNDSRTQQ